MQIKTKDELKAALAQLRATRKYGNSYCYIVQHLARYRLRPFNDTPSNIKYVTVIGEHQCAACGKQFGENLPQSKKMTASDKTHLLNGWIKIKNTIYQIHNDYWSFQTILAEYQKQGFDCRLDYYCNDCVQSGKHLPLKFSIRFDPTQEYAVSFPQIRINEQTWGDCLTLNYQIAFSFLTEHQDYQNLIHAWGYRLNNRESHDVKMLIDTSLEKILHLPIFYDKEEIVRHYLLISGEENSIQCETRYYKSLLDLDPDYIDAHTIDLRRRIKVLQTYPEDYQFSLAEVNAILEKMRGLACSPNNAKLNNV